MFYILKFLIYFFYVFQKKKNIVIIETHANSGSNTSAIARGLEKYNIEFDLLKYPIKEENENSINYKVRMVIFHIDISRYSIVLNTDGYKKIFNKQIVIDYWHGAPIKSMLYMEKGIDKIDRRKMFNNDYLITGSKLESTLLNSCMYIPFGRHRVLGNPRLDFLKDDLNILDYVIEDKNSIINEDTKIGIYMPTFRQSAGHGKDGEIFENIFNMEEFDSNSFEEFLVHNNICIIVKMHPLDLKRVSLIRNTIVMDMDKMIKDDIDLYQLLYSTDFLISDYSSIIYDYMILEKPIVMLNSDEEYYSNNRGFMYNPINRFIETELISTQGVLESKLKQVCQSKYKVKFHKTSFHELTSNNIERNIDFIKELLEKEGIN